MDSRVRTFFPEIDRVHCYEREWRRQVDIVGSDIAGALQEIVIGELEHLRIRPSAMTSGATWEISETSRVALSSLFGRDWSNL